MRPSMSSLWHEVSLVQALTIPNWLYYQTVDRVERTIEFLGIFGTDYGGLTIARASFNSIRANLKSIQQSSKSPNGNEGQRM